MSKADKTLPKKSYNDYFLADAAKYFYGDPFSDQYLLHDPRSLPRYGHLVRKAMMHYARDRYNPHEHGLMHEPFLRGMFKEIIERKILHRLPDHDWAWIDNSLKRYIGGCLHLDLPYDQAVIDRGYAANYAPKPINWDLPN